MARAVAQTAPCWPSPITVALPTCSHRAAARSGQISPGPAGNSSLPRTPCKSSSACCRPEYLCKSRRSPCQFDRRADHDPFDSRGKGGVGAGRPQDISTGQTIAFGIDAEDAAIDVAIEHVQGPAPGAAEHGHGGLDAGGFEQQAKRGDAQVIVGVGKFGGERHSQPSAAFGRNPRRREPRITRIDDARRREH